MNRRAAIAATAGVIVTLMLAGCGPLPVSREYLGDSKYGTFLPVPAGYATLDPAALGAAPVDGAFLQGFAGPGVSADQLFWGPSPAGVLRVSIVPGTLEDAKRAAENSFLADLRADVAAGRATLLQEPAVTREDDMTLQVDMLVEVTGPAGPAPGVVLVRSLIGKGSTATPGAPEAHVVKTLAVGCVDTCFTAQRATVDTMVQSWRVS